MEVIPFMKRLLSLLLVCMMLAGLAACRRDEVPEEPEATNTPAPQEILAASASDAAEAKQTHVPPASSSDAVLDDQAYGIALGYIDQPASALISAIGQPYSTEYSASCEQEGAEDGMLHYNGFSVWTMRTATGEIVRNVYLDQ